MSGYLGVVGVLGAWLYLPRGEAGFIWTLSAGPRLVLLSGNTKFEGMEGIAFPRVLIFGEGGKVGAGFLAQAK